MKSSTSWNLFMPEPRVYRFKTWQALDIHPVTVYHAHSASITFPAANEDEFCRGVFQKQLPENKLLPQDEFRRRTL